MSTGKVVHVEYARLESNKAATTSFPSYDFDYIKLSFNVTGNIAAPYTAEVILPKDHTSTFYLPVMPSIDLDNKNNLIDLCVTFSVTGNSFKLSYDRNAEVSNSLYVTLSYYKY